MMSNCIRLAGRRTVVVRGIKYAVVVGAVLIAINHGDAIVSGRLSGERLLKMALTVVVPYVVSTCSSVGALMEQRRAGESRAERS